MARFSAPLRLKETLREENLEGDKPWQIIAQWFRGAARHRVTGHSAEMAFFAVLTLVPSTVAVGSFLGLSEKFIGEQAVVDAEISATRAVRALIGPELTDAVIAPFVHQQLAQPRGGVAIGGLLIAWWLASHLFAATGNALDYAYGVVNRRNTMVRRLTALAFALGSVVVVAVSAELLTHGPLGRQGGFVRDFGMAGVYKTAWEILRWPLLLVIVVGFLVCLYHYSSSLRPSWRDCLWGALVGAVLWIVAAVAFRAITELGLRTSGVAADDPTVQIIGQSVNAVIATVLWAYLASIAILLGGEFNVLLRDRREAQRNTVVGFPFV